jgi:hypothetical protein
MATHSTTAAFDHSSDAGFQVWMQAFHDCFEFSGQILQVTSDTGQYNPSDIATATRPSTNTPWGYRIYAFNDTAQTTAPIFIKIEYGTGGSSSQAAFWWTVGTGSDGAGNITGVTVTRIQVNMDAYNSTTTAYPYLASSGDGYFNIIFNKGNFPGSTGFLFCMSRSFDFTGAPSTLGWMFVGIYGSPDVITSACYSYAVGSVLGTFLSQYYAPFIPGNVNSLIAGGSAQVMKWTSTFPESTPVMAIVSVSGNDLTDGTTFTATVAGTTSHTYKVIDAGHKATINNSNNGQHAFICFMWE